MGEILRVLKHGGICCIATEFILNGAEHDQYFTPEEFERIVVKADGFNLVGGELDLRISKSLLDYLLVIGVDNLSVSPHIVLQERGVFTSCFAFLKKQN